MEKIKEFLEGVISEVKNASKEEMQEFLQAYSMYRPLIISVLETDIAKSKQVLQELERIDEQREIEAQFKRLNTPYTFILEGSSHFNGVNLDDVSNILPLIHQKRTVIFPKNKLNEVINLINSYKYDYKLLINYRLMGDYLMFYIINK